LLYKIIIDIQEKNNLSDIDFSYILEDIFMSNGWNPYFGGEVWANIVITWRNLLESKTINDKITWIDHAYDLQHNTDTIFDKLQYYYKSGNLNWIKNALDWKFNVSNILAFYNKVSSQLKPFISYISKQLKGETVEMGSNKDYENWKDGIVGGTWIGLEFNGTHLECDTWAGGTFSGIELECRIWERGTFIGKYLNCETWENGIFKNGTFYSGVWKNGTFENGTFFGSIWENGDFYESIFGDNKNCVWENGKFINSTWENGIWENGLFKNSRWYNGIWKNGRFIYSTWETGIWEIGYMINPYTNVEFQTNINPKDWLDSIKNDQLKDSLDYMKKGYNENKEKNMITENILDPVRDSLSSKIFDKNMKMKQKVKDQISIALKPVLDKYEVNDIIFIGSMTGYQYNEYSDIDIHIRIDNISQQELDSLWDTIKSGENVNGTYHPINYYFYSGNEFEGKSEKGSAYDFITDKWIYPPKKEEIEIPYSYIMEIAKVFMSGIDERIREYEMDKKEIDLYEVYLKYAKEHEKEDIKNKISQKKIELEGDLDALKIISELIYKMRLGSYEGDDFDLFIDLGKGNKSIQNAVFKILEETGYKELLKKYEKIRKNLKKNLKNESYSPLKEDLNYIFTQQNKNNLINKVVLDIIYELDEGMISNELQNDILEDINPYISDKLSQLNIEPTKDLLPEYLYENDYENIYEYIDYLKENNIIDENDLKNITEIMKESILNYLYDIQFEFRDIDYIYREISMPKIVDVNQYIKKLKYKDYGKYDGIGVFWSINEETANIQWHKDFGIKKESIVKFKAVFDKNTINWYRTLYKACTVLWDEEQEIELKPGSQVLLEGFYLDNNFYECNFHVKVDYVQIMETHTDHIHGGFADEDSPNDFDREQLKIGIEIEMEHTNDPELAKEIAMDHLSEIPDYYTRLKAMEKQAEKDGMKKED
jgi:predicted nucleotidyltransferase